MTLLAAEPLKMAELIRRSNKAYLDLAYETRIPEQTWINWKQGKHSPRIKPHQLEAILKALNCSQKDFVEACREIDLNLNRER